MKNKEEIHDSVLDALKAVEKVQAMLTPEVISWTDEVNVYYKWSLADEKIAYDIRSFGLNLTLLGKEIEEILLDKTSKSI